MIYTEPQVIQNSQLSINTFPVKWSRLFWAILLIKSKYCYCLSPAYSTYCITLSMISSLKALKKKEKENLKVFICRYNHHHLNRDSLKVSLIFSTLFLSSSISIIWLIIILIIIISKPSLGMCQIKLKAHYQKSVTLIFTFQYDPTMNFRLNIKLFTRTCICFETLHPISADFYTS